MTYFKPVKPAGTLALKPNVYVRLDVPPIVPKEEGGIHHLVYLNVDYRLAKPTVAGKLTVKLVRAAWHGEAADPTAYQTFPLEPVFDADGDPIKGNVLITHPYFEWADPGRAVSWYVKIAGAAGTVGTRFAKGWQP